MHVRISVKISGGYKVIACSWISVYNGINIFFDNIIRVIHNNFAAGDCTPAIATGAQAVYSCGKTFGTIPKRNGISTSISDVCTGIHVFNYRDRIGINQNCVIPYRGGVWCDSFI